MYLYNAYKPHSSYLIFLTSTTWICLVGGRDTLKEKTFQKRKEEEEGEKDDFLMEAA